MIEVSSQNIEGFSTSIPVNNSGIDQKIFRPDIVYSDYHLKAMYGLPVSGGSVNSLANLNFSKAYYDNEGKNISGIDV